MARSISPKYLASSLLQKLYSLILNISVKDLLNDILWYILSYRILDNLNSQYDWKNASFMYNVFYFLN